MPAKSTSPPGSKFGRVFTVLRKWKPIDGNSDWKITTALSNSLSTLTICSPHVANAVRAPDMTAAGPSRDDSYRRQVQEGVITALTIAAPIVEGIPLAGPPLKAIIGGLLAILNAADRIIQNKEDIKGLEEKLRSLDNLISMVPVPPQGSSKHRDNLTRQLNATLTMLKSSREKRNFRYSSVAQAINTCSRDIDHYLASYTLLDVMHIRAMMEGVIASTSTTPGRITGIVLIDATGREHEVSMGFAKSYKIFTKAMLLLLDGDKMEARIQRRYMEQGRFDLCIDQGTQIVPIDGQKDWSRVEPGTKVVMRVVLVQSRSGFDQKYQCPRCRTWNRWGNSGDAKHNASIDCERCDGRFQISETSIDPDGEDRQKRGMSDDKDSDGVSRDTEMGVLVNFHLKDYVLPFPNPFIPH